jgi:hypothetical protein
VTAFPRDSHGWVPDDADRPGDRGTEAAADRADAAVVGDDLDRLVLRTPADACVGFDVAVPFGLAEDVPSPFTTVDSTRVVSAIRRRPVDDRTVPCSSLLARSRFQSER